MSIKANRFSVVGGGSQIPATLPRAYGDALLHGASIADLRSFAPLPDEAQRLIDKTTLDVGLERLTVAADLLSAGLTFPISDPLSVLEVYWESQSKVGGAQRTMNPGARGENQLLDRTGYRIPIYCTTDDFQLGIRLLRASARANTPLDLSHAKQALRRINEAIEDATLNGATTNAGTAIAVGGFSAPGLLNHSAVNTYAYTGNEAWDNSGHTGEEILLDVLAMVQKLQDDFYFGPYNLYVTGSYMLKLMQDFKAASDKTILQRLLEIPFIRSIKVADRLPANKTLLVQMTDDVVDVIVGQEPTILSWESANGMERHFMAMAIVVPRVKADYDGNSGVCVGFTS